MRNEAIERIVAEVLEMDLGDVSDNLTAEAAGRWDSLNHLRLITSIEEHFEVQLTMSEVEAAVSVRVLRETIARHLEAK